MGSCFLRGLLVAMVTGALCACSSDDGNGTGKCGAGVDPAVSDCQVAIPATAVGARLDWALSVLNGALPSEAEIEQHFDSAFLAQVPAADLLGVLSPLVARGPWKLLAIESGATALSLSAVVRAADGEYFRLAIAVRAAAPQRIGGLLLSLAADLDPALASDADIDAALVALAPSVNLMAANVGPDGCSTLHALNPNANLAIGSTGPLDQSGDRRAARTVRLHRV